MVTVAVVDGQNEGGWQDLIRQELKTATSKLSLINAPLDDPLSFLKIESNKPDILWLNAPLPIEKYIGLVRQLGIAKRTVITWPDHIEKELQEKISLEFSHIGVPLEHIYSPGERDSLAILNAAKKLIREVDKGRN